MFNDLASIILENLHRLSPHHFERIGLGPARQLTPAFFGCYDWHSCVHMHWASVRLIRLYPDLPLAPALRSAVSQTLTSTNIAAEMRFFHLPGQEAFEVPYGLAWLLQFCAELREWDDLDAIMWRRVIRPLESLAALRLCSHITHLPTPDRTGKHYQTAFALGLALDWARQFDPGVASLLNAACHRWFADASPRSIHLEPGPHDFLSPALAEADLMRRILSQNDFTRWVETAIPSGFPLTPVHAPDNADGQVSHLHGLNLSRAWMLDGIASALPPGHALRQQALSLAEAHKQTGVASTLRTRNHFMCSHWLPTFAIYCLTRRGLFGD